MKNLFARLRLLWQLAGCEHPKVECLIMPAGPEILHIHLCPACGRMVLFEKKAAKRMDLAGVGALRAFCQPAPGDERWN